MKSLFYPLGSANRIIDSFQIKKRIRGNYYVYVESRFGKELQKMQVIRAKHLHFPKEGWKESIC